jgi:hypothetical protein
MAQILPIRFQEHLQVLAYSNCRYIVEIFVVGVSPIFLVANTPPNSIVIDNLFIVNFNEYVICSELFFNLDIDKIMRLVFVIVFERANYR